MKHIRKALTVVAALGASLAPQAVLAAPASHITAPGESNLGYLFAGFAVVWLGFFAYVFYMGRRERSLRSEIDELRRQITQRPKDQP